MSGRLRIVPGADEMSETPQEQRLTLLGRATLEQCGFTDEFARKVRTRLEEGLDATKIKLFQHEGVVLESEPHTDYTERRLAAVEGAKLLDWYPNKLEHEVHGEVKVITIGLSEDQV